MKLVSLTSLGAVCVAVAVAHYLSRKPPSHLPWHDNDHWDRLFEIYDRKAAIQYADCDSALVETKFGTTQTHKCGSPENPPILFLHGAGSNSLIYGDWLIPSLKESHFSISIDYLCDVGKSYPKDMDPDNCPSTEEELAEWVQEVVTGALIPAPVTLVGYSYGSLVSFLVARHRPELVDKLILIAPAAVFAPIEFAWLWRAIVYGVTRTESLHRWFFRFMSADPEFRMDSMSSDDRNLTDAIRLVGGTILTVPSDSFEDNVLQGVVADHPTWLLIGENETVVNATLAADRAKTAGANVKMYSNAGHLMLMEEPARSQIAQDVAMIIKGQG